MATKNASVIVTGGASGIGAATAIALARNGTRVCVSDLNLEGAQEVANKIVDDGGQAFAIHTDVTDTESNVRMVEETLKRFDSLSGIFLNAGMSSPSSILDGNHSAWQKIIDVNLTGPYLGLSAAAPYLKDGSSVVFTASVAGLRGSAGSPAYIATKHGVIGLMKAAAAELTRHGVRANAICPGVIETPILGVSDRAILDGPLANMTPQRRIGQPEEVAELVVFLLSEKSKFINGQAYAIDGGMTQITPEGEAFPAQDQSITESLSSGNFNSDA